MLPLAQSTLLSPAYLSLTFLLILIASISSFRYLRSHFRTHLHSEKPAPPFDILPSYGLALILWIIITWIPTLPHPKLEPLKPFQIFLPFGATFLIFFFAASSGIRLSTYWKIDLTSWKSYLKWSLLLYLSILIPIHVITITTGFLFTQLGLEPSSQESINAFLSLNSWQQILGFAIQACIIAPLWEEMTFRGFIFPFLKDKIGINPAYIISGCFFALIHSHIASFIPLALLGIFLAWVFHTTGKLAYCILIHAFFNAGTLILLSLTKASGGLSSLN